MMKIELGVLDRVSVSRPVGLRARIGLLGVKGNPVNLIPVIRA